MNKTNVNVNGKFNVSAAIELAKSGFEGSDLRWSNLTIDGINYCYKLAEGRATQIAEIASSRNIDGIKNCNPYSAFMVQCMFGHNFINCPIFNNTIRGCDSLRNYLINCFTSLDLL